MGALEKVKSKVIEALKDKYNLVKGDTSYFGYRKGYTVSILLGKESITIELEDDSYAWGYGYRELEYARITIEPAEDEENAFEITLSSQYLTQGIRKVADEVMELVADAITEAGYEAYLIEETVDYDYDVIDEIPAKRDTTVVKIIL